MARIRSIKPDFFTSETIARLSVEARLTFIGLWTHVDDNGVCVLNEMLITAALYPLDDPLEALERVRESLRSLAGESLVTLYRVAGKQYMLIKSWDEHQKISHPGKPRYPRPGSDGCEDLTSQYANPPEDCRRAAGEAPETLRPEQGAGSREQGEDTPAQPVAKLTLVDSTAAAHPSDAPQRSWSDGAIDKDPHFVAFWNNYPSKKDKGHARRTWLKALRAGADPATITEKALAYRNDPSRKREFTAHAGTWLNGERWADEGVEAAPAGQADPSSWWNN